MGTNYYAHIDACPHCGRSDNVIHLGKLSSGWRFAVEVMDTENYHDWESFKSFIRQMNVSVRDGSGLLWSPEYLVRMAEERQNLQSHDSVDDPSRHVRRDGPVDLCFYEFS